MNTGHELRGGMDTTRLSLEEQSARDRRINQILAAAYVYRHDVPVDLTGDDEFDLLDVLGINPEDRTLGILAVQMVDDTPQGD